MIMKAGTTSRPKNNYPTSDGKPTAETDIHRDLMAAPHCDAQVVVPIEEKYNLYVEKLGVKEYFLFDPRQEYLKPSLQGYRKVKDRFRPIKPVEGRLPSKVLGLHLERLGDQLSLWNPVDGVRLPTPGERAAQAEKENEQLRREIEKLRIKRNGK